MRRSSGAAGRVSNAGYGVAAPKAVGEGLGNPLIGVAETLAVGMLTGDAGTTGVGAPPSSPADGEAPPNPSLPVFGFAATFPVMGANCELPPHATSTAAASPATPSV